MTITQSPPILSAEQLADDFGSNARVIARPVTFLYRHETYHTGQTEYQRQLAGTDDHVI